MVVLWWKKRGSLSIASQNLIYETQKTFSFFGVWWIKFWKFPIKIDIFYIFKLMLQILARQTMLIRRAREAWSNAMMSWAFAGRNRCFLIFFVTFLIKQKSKEDIYNDCHKFKDEWTLWTKSYCVTVELEAQPNC